MGKKQQRQSYTWEFKEKLVGQYLRKEFTAAQLATKHNLHSDHIYGWKYELEKRRKKNRAKELENEGRSPEDIRYIMQLEQENAECKKKIGQLTLEADLLKKVHPNFQHTKNVSGLERIKKELGLYKGRVK